MHKLIFLFLFQVKKTSEVTLAEWLTRCPAKALSSGRAGSNPAGDDSFLALGGPIRLIFWAEVFFVRGTFLFARWAHGHDAKIVATRLHRPKVRNMQCFFV